MDQIEISASAISDLLVANLKRAAIQFVASVGALIGISLLLASI